MMSSAAKRNSFGDSLLRPQERPGPILTDERTLVEILFGLDLPVAEAMTRPKQQVRGLRRQERAYGLLPGVGPKREPDFRPGAILAAHRLGEWTDEDAGTEFGRDVMRVFRPDELGVEPLRGPTGKPLGLHDRQCILPELLGSFKVHPADRELSVQLALHLERDFVRSADDQEVIWDFCRINGGGACTSLAAYSIAERPFW